MKRTLQERISGIPSSEFETGGLIHADIDRRLKERNGKNLRVFLLGTGIQSSISPPIHNALFQILGLNVEYSLLDLEETEFESAVSAIIDSNDVLGFNVTAPFKERIIPYISSMDEVATAVGAVNTVEVQFDPTNETTMKGFNTDVDGVIASLERLGVNASSNRDRIGIGGENASRRKATLLGAGGAARAGVYALIKFGFNHIVILNRSQSKSEALARQFRSTYQSVEFEIEDLKDSSFRKAVLESRLMINAVSEKATLEGLNASFNQTAHPEFALLDLGYKRESMLLRRARQAGIDSLDGLLMLAAQAKKSFEIWTGVSPKLSFVETLARQSVDKIQST